jgi:fatty acid-binding protein DegV
VISTGPFVRAYEGNPDGDGSTDLVLENDNILFAVRKYGNSTNYTSVNTSSLIGMIRNKRLGVDIRPKTTIYVNDSSATGSGYTELTARGAELTSAGIRVVMDSTIDYEALFTLDAGADFVQLTIRVL